MNKFGTITLGALIGAGLAYLIADWYVVNYMDEELHELDENETEEEKINEKFIIPIRKQKPVKKRENNKIKNYSTYFKDQNRPDLAALAAKYNAEELLEPGEQELIESELEIVEMGLQEPNEMEDPDMPDPDQDPAIITVAEYANNDEYSHETLHYYDDDVLTDEDDSPIDRPEKFLGDEALVSFGVLSQDEDTVYVRNHERKAMYEVVRLNKTYAAPVQPRRQALSRRRVVEDGENAE